MRRLALPLWLAGCVAVLAYAIFSDGTEIAADPVQNTLDCVALDGDTIRCGETRYRLWGLHAPERSDPGGPQAQAALAEIIAPGVSCEPTGATSWDRIVARCYVDGRDVAEMMVATGLAADCPAFSGGVYREFETDAGRALPLPDYCGIR